MFKRLSLPRYYCSQFRITLHFEGKLLATNVDQLQQNYGSRYKRNSEPHAVSGHLHPTGETGRYHVDVVYRAVDWGKPPKSFSKVDVLWDLVEGITEPLKVETIATMNYPEGDWESLVRVPIAFPEQFLGNFTHMEGVTFGKRTGDDLQYSVEFPQREEARIPILVRSFREAPFSSSLVANMFRECSRISQSVVRTRGKGHDA